jgi:hypothetical protein
MNLKEVKIRIIGNIVKFNKQGLAYLFFLARCPIIIYTTLILTYGILFYYFNSPCLCDGENLDELNGELIICTTEYNKLHNDYIHYNNLLSQAIYRPERNDIIVEYLSDKKISTFLEMSYKLNKIRSIEISIKEMNPNFISSIKKELHEYYF